MNHKHPKLKISKRLESLKPSRIGSGFDWLRYSCCQFGIQNPILHNAAGEILDGTKRFTIANEQGLKYRTRKIVFSSPKQEESWVIINSLCHPDPFSVQVKILEYLAIKAAAEPGEDRGDTIKRMIESVSNSKPYCRQRLRASQKYGEAWSRLCAKMRRWILSGHQVKIETIQQMVSEGTESQHKILNDLSSRPKHKAFFTNSRHLGSSEAVKQTTETCRLAVTRQARVARELGMNEMAGAAEKLAEMCKQVAE